MGIGGQLQRIRESKENAARTKKMSVVVPGRYFADCRWRLGHGVVVAGHGVVVTGCGSYRVRVCSYRVVVVTGCVVVTGLRCGSYRVW